MNVPEDLRYSSDHEWARTSDDRVRVGITDFAQDALGDVVFVDLPGPGTTVEPGGLLGEVESTKSVSEIYAPVGRRGGGRQRRADRRARAVEQPIPTATAGSARSPRADPAAVDALLDAAGYRQLTEG